METRPILLNMLFVDTSFPPEFPEVVYRVLRQSGDYFSVIRLPQWEDADGDSEAPSRSERQSRLYPEWWSRERLAQGLGSGLYMRTDADPFVCLRRDEDLTEVERRGRDARWSLVEPLLQDDAVFEPTTRNRALTKRIECLAQAGSHTTGSHLRNLLFLCWHRGQTPMSLVPDYSRCGTTPTVVTATTKKRGARRQPPSITVDVNEVPQGIVIDAQLKELMYRAGVRHYENRNVQHRAPTLRTAYERMIGTHFRVGFEIVRGERVPVLAPPEQRPSFAQFRWAYRSSRSKGEIVRSRRGDAYYHQHHRERLGSTRDMAYGPGSLYQFDPTNQGLYLRSSLFPALNVGRPTIYLVRDHFSHMFTGYSVSLESPGWVASMVALEIACSDKVEHCERHGIAISHEEWPCDGLPEEILTDRGELWSDNVTPMVERLGIKVNNTASRRPDLKGLIESGLHMISQAGLTSLPGAVDPKRDRGGPDPRRFATIDLAALHKIIIDIILEHNHEQDLGDYVPDARLARDGVPRRPIEYWRWGIENSVGTMHQASRTELRYHLMPSGEARVSDDGLAFHGLLYSSETGRSKGWFERGLGRAVQMVPIAYDPRDMSRIFLRLDGGRKIEECRLVDSQHHLVGTTLDEAIAYFGDIRARSRQQADRRTDSRIRLASRISGTVAECKESLSEAGVELPARAFGSSIRANAAEERRSSQAQDAWTSTGEIGQRSTTQPASQLPASHNALLIELLERGQS